MLAFRDQTYDVDPTALLDRLRERAVRGISDHDEALELLVDVGQLETVLVDTWNAECDSIDARARALRAASLAAGFAFVASCDAQHGRRAAHVARLSQALREIPVGALPQRARASVPEGYAHYGLYPETYVAAADRLWEQRRPDHAVVIGLRTIGTSLAAAVAAALARRGVVVDSVTVRPRGPQMERNCRLDESLRAWLDDRRHALFVVVDEGPGLSGSSFTAVAESLDPIVGRDDRIVFFPSWNASGDEFTSQRARLRWKRHARFHVPFEEWFDPRVVLGEEHEIVDISAGAWRSHFIADPASRPAVQPQHERRKLLSRDAHGRSRAIAKFVGFGDAARAKRARAECLADAGFVPRPLQLTRGFLVSAFREGRPLHRSTCTRATVERLAEYLAFVRSHFPAETCMQPSELGRMLVANASAALGPRWGEIADDLSRRASHADPIALDARMFPHEWIDTGGALLKTDAVDHADDHFYPGPADIAWDLAATVIEFDCDACAEARLLASYALRSGDRAIADRLGFYRAAYTAFRVGYATLATRAPIDPEDVARFEARRAFYARVLKRTLAAEAPRLRRAR
jgi:hypothetical protein